MKWEEYRIYIRNHSTRRSTPAAFRHSSAKAHPALENCGVRCPIDWLTGRTALQQPQWHSLLQLIIRASVPDRPDQHSHRGSPSQGEEELRQASYCLISLGAVRLFTLNTRSQALLSDEV